MKAIIINQVVLFAVLAFTLTSCQKKTGDEGRPYEFGFTIDGEQHRYEKKDDKGIVQGEFGFITADGIYHVTVYATDENGKFKILSMKNLRISAPLDGSPFKGEISPEANKYRKQANLPLLPAPNALSIPEAQKPEATPQSVAITPKPVATPFKFSLKPTIKPACAGCGLVAADEPTTKPSLSTQYQGQNVPSFGIQSLPSDENSAGKVEAQNYKQQNQNEVVPPQYEVPQYQNADSGNQHQLNQELEVPYVQEHDRGVPGTQQYQPAVGPQNTNYKPFGQSPNTAASPGGTSNNAGFQASPGLSNVQGGGQYSSEGEGSPNAQKGPGFQYQPASGPQTTNYQSGTASGSQYPNQNQAGFAGNNNNPSDVPEANPLQIPGQGPQNQVSNLPPISVDGNVIHVGGSKNQDIPIKDKFPGMKEGLPEGIEEKDITQLLYKFHYTVGFHGHYEKGLKNGAKIGGYFVNGRDGISRVVTYIADENGYRPKVKFINLGLESDETPKAETEKKFGLKSFEFVWYPL
ncbi:unnamed protein product [Ceutorhynchus assimilis]|uniref:Protein lethal(3)malignant blood neoplasm 1 n=1 Tax=Ceutorhynchus assimilis TaxID=467358 RepID=A0A9P0DK73_9CUCU|nr:unnamed protein product [Ceutorhynchus assimilis]